MDYTSNDPLDQLRDIHRLMQRSSKFIGLSGLSGVGAGAFALVGSSLAQLYLLEGGLHSYGQSLQYWPAQPHPWGLDAFSFFTLDALFVLSGALSCGVYFTTRRAQRKGHPIWDSLTRRLLLSVATPLAIGGLFVLAMLYHGWVGIVAPATLIFYGIALISGSTYTLDELYYLGLAEVSLGIIGLFFLGYGLLLWAIGFGLLHIIYGLLMYFRYETSTNTKHP
ncbi:MAG: hypothetical protein D6772_17740 [Bacteroidetes bacterium]|nr:MAG: hypothetical protein D6772_17740 [Bacteroidota bacterium]